MKSANRVLTTLTAVNHLNYIDRFMLAALLPAIQNDLHLNDFQAGLLASAFMVAYVIAAPLSGHFGDHHPRTKLLSLGVLIWSLASLSWAAHVVFFRGPAAVEIPPRPRRIDFHSNT